MPFTFDTSTTVAIMFVKFDEVKFDEHLSPPSRLGSS